MRHVLTDKMVEAFQREGVMFPVDVLVANEVRDSRARLDQMQQHLGGRLRRIDFCHLHFRWACDLVLHPRVLDPVEDLLGPDLFVHSSRVFYKHPRDPAFVTWHQDGTYSDLNSSPGVSAWIALSESNTSNGCVRVVVGSHRNDRLEHRETFGRDNLLNHGEEICYDVSPERIRDLVLRPGQMSLHHVNMIHGSQANQSDMPRIGFSISYVTPAVRTSRWPVLQARGTSTDHEFELVEAVTPCGMAESFEAHREFVAERGLQPVKMIS